MASRRAIFYRVIFPPRARELSWLCSTANGQPAALGWIGGNPAQVVNQLIGAGIGIGLAVVGTLAALKITDLVTPLRMKEREEDTGMDLSLHGEEGYNFEA